MEQKKDLSFSYNKNPESMKDLTWTQQQTVNMLRHKKKALQNKGYLDGTWTKLEWRSGLRITKHRQWDNKC
jgi:hypothetical protein